MSGESPPEPAQPEGEGGEAPEVEETPEQKAERGAAEAAAQTSPEGEEEPTPDSPEGRIKAAQTKMHTATQETATERKAREAAESRAEAAEKERDDLKKQLAAVTAKPPVKPGEASAGDDELDPEVEKVATAATREALRKIDGLDPDDPDYEDRRAQIWARTNAKIVKAATTSKSPMSQEAIDQLVDQRIEARETKTAEERAEAVRKENAARAWDKALDQAEKAGLSVRDKKSADSRIFHDLEREIPEELYGKFDEAAQWLIAETQTCLGRKVEQTEAEKAAAKVVQKRNTVLGRGDNPPPKQPFKPKTLSEMYG
jgi:hypothetical protein